MLGATATRNPKDMRYGIRNRETGCVFPHAFATMTDAIVWLSGVKRAYHASTLVAFLTSSMTDADFEREYHLKRS